MKQLLVLTTLALAAAGPMAKGSTPDTLREPKASLTGLLRILKADGGTAARALVDADVKGSKLRLRARDAQSMAGGLCTFSVRLDAVSSTALGASVNRLYANDVLLAQTPAADLQAKTLVSTDLALSLPAGATALKIVLDADGARPMVGRVALTVDGSCTADEAVTRSSPAWRALTEAADASHRAVRRLKNQSYAGYEALVAVDDDLAAAEAAKTLSQAAYDTLMARWSAIADDADFKAALAAAMPGDTKPGKTKGKSGDVQP